jgi:sugar phosphate isomerase/epimerase
MLGGMPPIPAAKQFAESMKPILDRADALGIDRRHRVRAGLVSRIHVAELREWIDKLNHPRLGANLDVGHLPGHRRKHSRGCEAHEGPRIWNLHVEDIPGRKHYHMIPGEGTLDWNGLRDALQGNQLRPLRDR